eukprot:363932-Chlamydomonas_euryale.AAC.9
MQLACMLVQLACTAAAVHGGCNPTACIAGATAVHESYHHGAVHGGCNPTACIAGATAVHESYHHGAVHGGATAVHESYHHGAVHGGAASLHARWMQPQCMKATTTVRMHCMVEAAAVHAARPPPCPLFPYQQLHQARRKILLDGPTRRRARAVGAAEQASQLLRGGRHARGRAASSLVALGSLDCNSSTPALG